MTLTDTQARVLQALRDGGEGRYWYGYERGVWSIRTGPESWLGTVAADGRALSEARYVAHACPPRGDAYDLLALTPAGAEALAQWEAGR